MIEASEELKLAVGEVARPVSRAVQTRPGFPAEGIGNKLFGSHLRAIQVAARDVAASDV